jgi:hypothetical protein
MLRIMAGKKRWMESSVPMIMAERKENAFHFQEKGNREQSREGLPYYSTPYIVGFYGCHGLASRISKWSTMIIHGVKSSDEE